MADVLEHLRAALAERYEIERVVGEGGMATVYVARDVRHGRKVAIKTLRAELSASIGADRFLREIRVAAALQHPNILPLYDSGDANGILYYVMPFVEGESLRDRLNREQQLPLQEAVRITREAAEALAYAHQHGVVHRDIKPENIMLQNGHAMVADFGIARAVGAAGEKLTQTGMAVGTPHYMSPEQALGADHADGRSDVYSLGCVLYELLIGQPPFDGPNAMAILARHSMEQVPSLRIVRQSIPEELEEVVMQALEKTPADRFQKMGELAETLADLEATVATRRTTARAIPATRRTSTKTTKAVRRPTPEAILGPKWGTGVRFRILAAAALLLLTVGGFGAARWLRADGTDAGASSDLPPNRIAVLYFEKSAGGSDSLGYLADGITEALIHELGRVQGLAVISGNGVRPYRGSAAPPDSVGRALRVGTLVQGRLAQSGNQLRLSISLINAATGAELGSKILERPRQEIFALQDDLAKEVAFYLRQRLGQEVEIEEHRAGTTSTVAWEYMQRSRQEASDAEALLSAGDSAGAARKYERADSMLAKAEAADPKWPAPAARRGWLAYRRSRMAPLAPPAYHAEVIRNGLVHAEKALQLDPNDPDALEVRGTLRYWQWLSNLTSTSEEASQLYADAERDLRGSVEANPSQASAWTTLSHLLINKPALGEAKLAAMRAYDADPYLSNANVTIWRLFTTSYDLEDANEAKKWCDEGKRRFPQDYRFAECELWLYQMKAVTPDIPQAWQALDRYVKLSPASMRPFNQLQGQMRVAAALARAGLADSARNVARRSEGDPTIDANRNLSEQAAQVYTILGDYDEALRQLSLFLAANPQQREVMAKDQAWALRDLRSDPRYAALVGKAK